MNEISDRIAKDFIRARRPNGPVRDIFMTRHAASPLPDSLPVSVLNLVCEAAEHSQSIHFSNKHHRDLRRSLIGLGLNTDAVRGIVEDLFQRPDIRSGMNIRPVGFFWKGNSWGATVILGDQNYINVAQAHRKST